MKAIFDFLSVIEPTEQKKLSAGEYLFRQNDAARGLYLVKQGRLKLLRDTVDGNQVIMHIATANETIAEASIFSKRYHCHAKADQKSSVALYDKQKILTLLAADSDSALKFIQALTQQVQRLRLLMELRGVRSPRERLLQYCQIQMNKDGVVSINSTIKDLAVTLGMTHETLYRVLGQLQTEGLIEKKENALILRI